ncbi:MAG: 30S ribosomal protein S16 [Chloroflexota bacterium]|nr:30S ribosomal protein S16 [Chloroflexota bacterium]
MVKIRLTRVGRKKQPSYRVVVADAKAPRDGDFIEIIGHYNPRTEPATIVIDGEKARKWLSQGAKPTERVSVLLGKLGIVDMPERKFAEKPIKQSAKKPAQEPTAESKTSDEGEPTTLPQEGIDKPSEGES